MAVMHLLPYYGLGFAFVGFISAAVQSQRKAIRLTANGWEDLVARLQTVEIVGLNAVARDYLNPRESQLKMEPQELWTLLGGHDGLRRMRANADLMLALAAHAQHWNFDEATIVAERMRLDAERLRRAMWRIELGCLPHFAVRRFWMRVPIQAQEVAAAYYLMRQRLLSLYATSHAGLYPRLAEAL